MLDTHYLGHGKPYLLGDKLSIADYLGAAIISAGDLVGVDLKRFPKNGWALRGLERSLRAQGKTAEADEAGRKFKEAWGEEADG